jgi:hypothetical protein
MHRQKVAAQSWSAASRGQDEDSWGYAGEPMDTAEIRCQSFNLRTKNDGPGWGDFSQCPSAFRSPTLDALDQDQSEVRVRD